MGSSSGVAGRPYAGGGDGFGGCGNGGSGRVWWL